MRVCLDTNVLVSGIFWKGIPGKILDLWIEDRFDLIGTLLILGEYQRILKRLGQAVDERLVQRWIEVLIEKMIIIVPGPSVKRWSRDIHDDKFIEGSLASKADYLVTGDKDLLNLEIDFPFQIVKAKKFLAQLKQ